jgi:hypothetical protein
MHAMAASALFFVYVARVRPKAAPGIFDDAFALLSRARALHLPELQHYSRADRRRSYGATFQETKNTMEKN